MSSLYTNLAMADDSPCYVSAYEAILVDAFEPLFHRLAEDYEVDIDPATLTSSLVRGSLDRYRLSHRGMRLCLPD